MPELRNINLSDLEQILSTGTKEDLNSYCQRNDLEIKNGRIYARTDEAVTAAVEFWDKRQLVRKIQLNSLYGAILNASCRFFDHRIGQSTTLTGRIIAKHMDAHVNEAITGEYDHTGKSVIYGDSVTGDTMIRTDSGQISIAELYNQCQVHERHSSKEYGVQSFAKVVGFNAFEDAPVMANISYVMRHKTKKKLYKITLQNDKTVTVTEDHSVMVDRDGFLIEVRPTEILDTDLIICLKV